MYMCVFIYVIVCRVTTLQTELQEERGLASALASSHKQWQEQARKTEEALTKEVRYINRITDWRMVYHLLRVYYVPTTR